jgi:tetratricopeptide (TPR) repeat protein
VLADRWYEHYERASDAEKAGEWETVIEEIISALEKKADSSARARTYGMNFTSYFPYYKLGVAYFELGQLDAALQALETEEHWGEIEQSERDHDELIRIRSLIEEARKEAADEERRRIDSIVDERLADAARFETREDLDAAMRAVGEALAVAPDNPGAKLAMERLRSSLAQLDALREVQDRAAGLAGDAEAMLAEGKFEEAAALLDQAFGLAPSTEIEALRERAQARLRAEIEAMEDAEELRQFIADGLRETRSLEAEGELVEALTRLQPVLAVDPENDEALALQTQLQQAQVAVQQERARSDTIRRLETEVEQEFEAKRFETALSASNRLLALDPTNAVARRHIAGAYREINRRILGTGTRGNLPPAIRFADFRETELDDGLKVQEVRGPRFRLTGTIFDDAPVDLSFEIALHVSGKATAPGSYRPVDATVSSQPMGDNTLSEFNLDHTLEPGLSVFRIEATDPEGLRSSSEYAVIYVRPLTRSPWFYGGLAVAAAGLVAVAFGYRRRRLNRLRKRRFNPYVAGAPVLDDDLFFGRDRLIDRILQTVHNNSLLLFGERRIGKTSIQHHLKRRLQELDDPGYEFYPVYIDLQGTPENRFFSTMAQDVFEDLAPVLGGLKPGADLSGDGYSYRDFVRDLREVIKTLKKRNKKKVKLVLLIDEVDELNDYDPRVNQKLRSLFMKSFADNLVAVVSGVGIKKHWESEGSPWYNFFEEIEVKPFAREDADELIRRPMAGMFKVEPGVIDRIVALTDCRPYLIQKMCIDLVDRMHQEKRRTITVDDVERVGRPEA